MRAMPSEPPTWRMLFRTADPTPALSTGTEPIAAAVVGVIVNAMPVPPVSSAGRKFQNVAPASSCANSTSDTATRVMPNPISHLAPIVSVSRPAWGA